MFWIPSQRKQAAWTINMYLFLFILIIYVMFINKTLPSNIFTRKTGSLCNIFALISHSYKLFILFSGNLLLSITFPRKTSCFNKRFALSVFPAPLSPLITIAWFWWWCSTAWYAASATANICGGLSDRTWQRYLCCSCPKFWVQIYYFMAIWFLETLLHVL